MSAYDGVHFDPPAPVADATLRCSQSGRRVENVSMLLDTGSDITLVPRVAVEQIGVPPLPGRQYELMGFDGSRSFAGVVILDLILLGKVFRGQYSLTEQTRGVLGRDVLNHLAIAINGPALEWSQLVR